MKNVFSLMVLTAAVLVAGRSPAVAQGIFSRISVGSHAGVSLDDGRIDRERVGGHVSFSLIGRLEFWAGLNAETNPLSFGTIEGTVSSAVTQGLFTARVRPFGTTGLASLLYTGYGLTFRRVSLSGGVEDGTTTTEWTDLALLGVELPVGRIRPFAELQVIDIFDREETAVANLYFGVNFKLR